MMHGKSLKHVLIVAAAVAVSIIVFLAMGAPVRLASVSSYGLQSLSSRHWYLTEKEARDIALSAGETLAVTTDIKTKDGDITVEIVNDSKEIQFLQTKDQQGNQTFTHQAAEDETLTLNLTAKKHRGSFQIDWSISP